MALIHPSLVVVFGPSIDIGAGKGLFHLNRSVIHEGDMERGSGKPPYFDGTNYPYRMIRMFVHLQEQIDQRNANSKAHSILFLSLSLSEFERVSDCTTAREIYVRL